LKISFTHVFEIKVPEHPAKKYKTTIAVINFPEEIIDTGNLRKFLLRLENRKTAKISPVVFTSEIKRYEKTKANFRKSSLSIEMGMRAYLSGLSKLKELAHYCANSETKIEIE